MITKIVIGRALYIILFSLFSVFCFSQENGAIVYRGATNELSNENLTEYYAQRRAVFRRVSLGNSTSFIFGLNQFRVESTDFLEFPALFRFQSSPNLNIELGPQIEFTHSRSKGNILWERVSISGGTNYNITKTWDASIQYVAPVIEGANITPLQPIRLRTAIKF